MLDIFCGYKSKELKELTWTSGETGTKTNYKWCNMTDDVVQVFIGPVSADMGAFDSVKVQLRSVWEGW